MTAKYLSRERRYAENLRKLEQARREVAAGRMTVEQAAKLYGLPLIALKLDAKLHP